LAVAGGADAVDLGALEVVPAFGAAPASDVLPPAGAVADPEAPSDVLLLAGALADPDVRADDLLPAAGLEAGAVAAGAVGGGVLAGMADVFTPGSRSSGGGAWRAGAGWAGGDVCAKAAGPTANRPTTNHHR
jgi:hypothetical protein